MTDKERYFIKSMSSKTGLSVSRISASLNKFKEIGIYPTASQLVEYIRMKGQPIARYKINDKGEKVLWTDSDYMLAAMKNIK